MKAASFTLRLALCAVVVSVFVETGKAQAQLPGRTTVADLVRLAAYGQGPVDAVTAGIWATPGARGQGGFGPASCDENGMTYRTIVKPRVQVAFEAMDTQRLDLIIRGVAAVQDLTVRIDGEDRGTFTLSGGWQRLTVRTPALKSGQHQVELVLTPTGGSLATAPGVAPSALAMLHSIRPSEQVRPSKTPAHKVFAHHPDALWLETGETYRVALADVTGLALETAGLKTTGSSAKNIIRVELETLDGAIQSILDWPTALAMPWNLALERKGLIGGAFLRITYLGQPDSAVGLVRPKLTRPSVDEVSAPAGNADQQAITLVLIPGLRSDDVDALAAQAKTERVLASASRLGDIWAVDVSARSAVTSALTGLYPTTHGVKKRTDRLATATRAIGARLKEAGKRSILRVGQSDIASDDATWSGFTDPKFASRETFRETAEAVLKDTVSSQRQASDADVTVVVLGDLLAPLLPRREDWKAYWGADSPLWTPMDSRRQFAAIRSGKMKRTENVDAFITALRRGKAEEVMRALTSYLEERPTTMNGKNHVVIIAGLAGRTLADATGPEPADLLGPLWVAGDPLGPKAATRDLTDLAPLVLNNLGISVGAMQGSATPSTTTSPHTDLAFSSTFDQWDTVARHDLFLRAERASGKTKVSHREGRTWTPLDVPNTQQSITIRRMTRQLAAWRSAGSFWRESLASPAHATGRNASSGVLCE